MHRLAGRTILLILRRRFPVTVTLSFGAQIMLTMKRNTETEYGNSLSIVSYFLYTIASFSQSWDSNITLVRPTQRKRSCN